MTLTMKAVMSLAIVVGDLYSDDDEDVDDAHDVDNDDVSMSMKYGVDDDSAKAMMLTMTVQ